MNRKLARKPTSSASAAGKTEARQILDSIRKIVQVLRVASRAAEKGVGLSGAQLFVLHHLAGHDGLSLNELAEKTLTHQSSVSVVVQRLVDRGLVSRVRSEVDARRIELSLTRGGRTLLGKSPQAAQDQIIDAVQRMPEKDRRSLSRTLGTLIAELGLEEEPALMLFEEDSKHRKAAGNGRTRD
ncbi:MAG TPA: MarR family winged helix-turn-helix transcriptional regulator [Tepidisphaeraceae bacterium]|jgi:DNA-binding MarR family transcriptional regulator|nr:MarR family winged helix-turn-helix transcriptional regulator [Tepidisphaeraceae bacterium]